MTYYSCSYITERRRDTTISSSFINRIQNVNPTTGSAPYLGITNQSIINTVKNGQMTQYRKNDGGSVFISLGAPLPVPLRPVSSLYTLTYNKNGGTGTFSGGTVGGTASEVLSIQPGTTITVPSKGTMTYVLNMFYPFINWNTSADGYGTSYASNNTLIINTDITLYAQWFLSITYNKNGGTGKFSGGTVGGTAPEVVSNQYGITIMIPNQGTMTNGSQTLIRWTTSQNGSGTSYLINSFTTPSVNIILYAQWV